MTAAHTVGGGWDAWSCGMLALAAGMLWLLPGWLKAARLALQLPGPPALPLLGNALLITAHAKLQVLGKTSYQEYGKLYRVWITVFPMFMVLAPEDVQMILGSPKHTDKISLYRLLHNFLGEGLITSSGNDWRSHRKLLQPSFHINNLEEFVATFSDCAQTLAGKLRCTGPEGINITTFVNDCVLDILNEAVLGISLRRKTANSAAPKNSPFRKGEVFMPYRIMRPWLLFSWVYRLTDLAKREMQQKNNLMQFTKEILEDRRNETHKEAGISNPDNLGCKSRKCLLDYLIAIGNKNDDFTDKDIANEICTFMLAGQDSVGGAVAFALFMLAKHQDVQERVVEELDAIFQGSGRAPTRQDLGAMRFLEQCIKETLRLYPSVPIVARRLGDDVNLGKHTLPAGCDVLISPFIIHRLPHIYPEPAKFQPSRFSPENVEGRHPYAFIPFSAGPRNCIGYKFALLEMKTVVSTVLRQFRLQPVPGKEELTLTYRITLRSKGGVWLQISPREPHSPATQRQQT